MKILLHMCCAPCSIYPVEKLKEKSWDILGFFYRHNIHPYTECIKRQQTLIDYTNQIDIRVIVQNDYQLEEFIRHIAFRELNRCEICYHERLKATAHVAKQEQFDYFSTTLLYSKFQNHDMIQSMGNAIGKSVGVRFFYEDFRKGWKYGVEQSKKRGMYRQQYCGCIFSEKERYYK